MFGQKRLSLQSVLGLAIIVKEMVNFERFEHFIYRVHNYSRKTVLSLMALLNYYQ